MDFEYNFLCWFARAVARRMSYISVLDYLFVQHHCGATQRVFEKILSSPLFVSQLTRYEYPGALQPLLLSSILRYK